MTSRLNSGVPRVRRGCLRPDRQGRLCHDSDAGRGSDRDAFCGAQVFGETAALLPRCHLMFCKGKGHMGAATGARLRWDVLAFLDLVPASFPAGAG